MSLYLHQIPEYAQLSPCCYKDLLFVYQGQVAHILRDTIRDKDQIFFQSICDSTMPIQKGLYTFKTLPGLNTLCKGCQAELPKYLLDKALLNLHGFQKVDWLTADLLTDG